MKNAAPKIRLLRAERLLSQRAVAEAIQVSAGRFSQLENGYGPLPTKAEVKALAEFFAVKPAKLGIAQVRPEKSEAA